MNTSVFRYKKISKYIGIMLILLLSQTLSAQVNEDYFKVSNTTLETFAGGAYGSGSSASYTFTLKFKKKVSICIDTIWFQNVPKIAGTINSPNYIKGDFKKGDSLNIAIGFYYPGERDRLYIIDDVEEKTEKEVIVSLPSDKPYIALIQFYVKGVKYYYGVTKIDRNIFNALP